MYETRKEAADACKYEAAAAERFSTAAIRKASEGQCSAAWRLADQARMAARCAMQAHESLWALAGEDMTEAEFDSFEKAEIAQVSASRAERAAAAAVEKLNAAQNAAQNGLPPKLDALCEKTGTRPEGIKVLMTYYTENSGWTEQQAVEHIEKLFADGTIEALKKLK